MDTALLYYQICLFPVDHRTPFPKCIIRRSAYILFCFISFLLVIYHEAHLWTYYFWTHVSQNESLDITFIGKMIGYLIQSVCPVLVKFYLICGLFYKTKLQTIVNILTNQSAGIHLIKTHCNITSRDHKLAVSFMLVLNLVAVCVLTHAAGTLLVDCYSPSLPDIDDCHLAYVTPVFDLIGEWIDELTIINALSMVPIMASIACLQFASTFKAFCISNDNSIAAKAGKEMIQLAIQMCELQNQLAKQTSGWLFIQVSLTTIHMISVIPMIVRNAWPSLTIYNYIFIAVEFSYMTLLCYASNQADDAVSRLLSFLIFSSNQFVYRKPYSSAS